MSLLPLGAARFPRRVAMTGSELAAPSPPKPSADLNRNARSALGRIGDRISLAIHRLAHRLDRVPSDFGRDPPVDENDAKSVRAEWRRHLRQWAAYNPGEVFLLEVGGVLLAMVIVAIWIAIAVFA